MKMLFSVVIPFYNVEEYVDKCVQSVINQTYRNLELIAVDDGSTDSTGRLLDSYAENDNRIRVIHKMNGGLTSARKAGARECKGDYVLIVDGDDWISENCLEKYNTILEGNPVDVIVNGYNIGDEGKFSVYPPFSTDGKYGYFDEERMEREYLPYLFSIRQYAVGKVYKKELYLKYQLQLDDVVTMGEDIAISYPCIANAKSIYTLNEPHYYYRYNPKSMTKSKKKYLSWECTLTRTAHLEKILPLDKFSYQTDFWGMTAHSVFNVVLSHIKNDKYRDAVKDAKNHLQREDVKKWIDCASKEAKGVNKILAVVLKYRLFFLIKAFCIFTKHVTKRNTYE